MKKLIFLLAVLALISSSCSSEADDNTIVRDYTNLSYRIVAQNTNASRDDETIIEICKTVEFIAGQNQVAGSIHIYFEDDELVIVYEMNEGWTVPQTHLAISDCDLLSFPINNAGNPAIGNFPYSGEHPDDTNHVAYYFNAEDVGSSFCLALHAVVVDSNGNEETAWGEGIAFSGNSWASYIEFDVTQCPQIADDEVR